MADAAVADAASSSIDAPCPQATGPNGANCENAFRCAGRLQGNWVRAQEMTGFCTSSPPRVPDELYSHCATLHVINACSGLAVGQQFCSGGALTALCQQDSDCPAAARCGNRSLSSASGGSFGVCEKPCSTAGNAECGTCDRQCDLGSGLCTAPSTGYPTNLPCDDTHGALDVSVDIPLQYAGVPMKQITLEIPGSGRLQFYLLEGTTSQLLPYPSAATSGPATATLYAVGPGPNTVQGSVDFQSDPSTCTHVTIPGRLVTQADAGP